MPFCVNGYWCRSLFVKTTGPGTNTIGPYVFNGQNFHMFPNVYANGALVSSIAFIEVYNEYSTADTAGSYKRAGARIKLLSGPAPVDIRVEINYTGAWKKGNVTKTITLSAGNTETYDYDGSAMISALDKKGTYRLYLNGSLISTKEGVTLGEDSA